MENERKSDREQNKNEQRKKLNSKFSRCFFSDVIQQMLYE